MNTGEYRIRTDLGAAAAPLRLNGYGPRTSGTGGRGSLLTTAGTVELVGFACAARPRRLVKE